MPPIKRKHKMTVMLSDDEREFRDEVVLQLGGDSSSIVRQGLIELGKRIGLKFPLPKRDRPARKGRAS